MSRREMEQDLQDLFEGTLDWQRLKTLEEILASDAEARDAYLDYAELHNALQLRAEGIDLLRVVPMDKIVARRQRKFFPRAVMGAAAVILLGMMIMAILIARTPAPTLQFASSPGSDLTISHPLGDDGSPKGAVMEPGSRLEIRLGTVELSFQSGVRGIVRGPADLTLEDDDHLHLAKGVVWVDVAPGAEGFKVSTPDLHLTDLGTRFGVISKPNFLDEVHVFEGLVEIRSRLGLRQSQQIRGGEAWVAGPAGRWLETELNPAAFLKELPKAEAFRVDSDVVISKEASTNQFAYVNMARGDDLLHGLVPIHRGWNLNNDANPLDLTDGIHGVGFEEVAGDAVQGAWTTVGATAEYHLGSGPHGLGYDLTEIHSIAAWNSAGFGNQTWAVEVKPVNGDFVPLAEVDHNPFDSVSLEGGGATRVVLTGKSGLLARGVEAIRFTAGHVPGSVRNAFVWRELDVLGNPTSK